MGQVGGTSPPSDPHPGIAHTYNRWTSSLSLPFPTPPHLLKVCRSHDLAKQEEAERLRVT